MTADEDAAAPAGAFRRPRPDERAGFEHLQQRGYASGAGTLRTGAPAGAPVPEAEGAGEDPDGGARGYFVGGRAVAGAYLQPYQTWWGADELPMESVGGVVALPEARRRGYTAAVMAGAVSDMRERGVPISTITTPFSYAFYRRMGWEYAFRRVRAELAPDQAAAAGAGAGGEARFVASGPDPDWIPGDMDAIYRRVMRERYQGGAARPPALWRAHLEGDRTYAYVWEGADGPAGYVIASAGRGDVLRIRELFALDRGALRGLFRLLANFDSQAGRIEWDMPPDVRLDLLVPEQGDLQLSWRPEGMFRIVDVALAVAGRASGAASGRVRLRLLDDQAPWNRGPFDIEWSDGRATARPGPGGAVAADEAAMDQRTFSQIYAGAVTPAEAARQGLADIGAGALRVLTAAYVTGRPPLLLERH